MCVIIPDGRKSRQENRLDLFFSLMFVLFAGIANNTAHDPKYFKSWNFTQDLLRQRGIRMLLFEIGKCQMRRRNVDAKLVIRGEARFI